MDLPLAILHEKHEGSKAWLADQTHCLLMADRLDDDGDGVLKREELQTVLQRGKKKMTWTKASA